VLHAVDALDALGEDVLLEEGDGQVGVLGVPVVEDLELVLLVELLGQLDVLKSHLLAGLRLQQVLLRLELVDRALDATHDRPRPGDRSRLRRHVLRDRRVLTTLLEQLVHLGNLLLVALKHVDVLVAELVLDVLAGLDIFEFVEEVEGALGALELIER
jgi:hypothetical protein